MTRPSEAAIIARFFAPLAAPGGLGLQDDAALATPTPGHDLVVTKDMLVAGIHFFSDDPPDAIARKALRVNLSDLAAKGARPAGFLLGLALPPDWTQAWLEGFASGLGGDATIFGCPLLGGDTVATPGPLTISITAFGEVASGRMVPRTGARPGDLIYVTGAIGDAALGLAVRRGAATDRTWIAALDPAMRRHLLDRYDRPEPRLALRPALGLARAAMDVSDGLVGDLDKMLALEGLGLAIPVASVPFSPAVRAAMSLSPPLMRAAVSGGDDYEILVAVAPELADAFATAACAAGVPVAELGRAAPGPGVILVDAAGVSHDVGVGRFDHFA